MALGTVSSIMSRPAFASRSMCQICDAIAVRRLHTAKTLLTTQNVSGSRRLALCHDLRGIKSVRGRTLLGADRPRGLTSSVSRRSTLKEQHEDSEHHEESQTSLHHKSELSSLTNMTAFLENSKAKVIGHQGIPAETDISAALRACKVVADYIMDESVQPQISHMATETDSATLHLLSLDSTRLQTTGEAQSNKESVSSVSTQLKRMINKISDTAYATVAHPTVLITPRILEQYVAVQASLGRPETLPQVFDLYASKPVPREASGSIKYAKTNSHKAAQAIDPEIVETALDTAIEAKNLDAAVGIVENSYATNAFIRSKLLRRALFPCTIFATTPVAAYVLATRFSVFQESMDSVLATNVAFVGILAYVAYTTTLGVVAITTANDQMKRVTWAPGIPLHERWLREEERAALDKIACAWGFPEKWRQGEEEGADWDALREYIGQKGMILDRTELMEGME